MNKYTLCFSEGDKKYLLYNPINKAIAEIDEEALNLLNKKQDYTLEERKGIDALTQHKFLVPEDYNELEEIKNLEDFKKQRKISTRFSCFEIIVTWECNLNCEYCFEKPIKGIKKESLDIKKVKKIFEFIDRHLIDKKEKYMPITGGEPLLIKNKVVLSKILEEGEKRDFKFHITTNGTTLREYSDLLLRYKRNIFQVRVTIDGPKEVHNKRRPFLNGKGSFDKIVEGVNFILKKGFNNVLIITKFDEKNISYIGDTVEMFKKLGWLGKIEISFGIIGNFGVNAEKNMFERRSDILIKMLTFFKKHPQFVDVIEFDDESNSVEMVKALAFMGKLPETRYFGCNAFRLTNVISFAPDGKLYPCVGLSTHDMYTLGNYLDPYLDLNAISQIKNRNIINLKKCHDCKFLLICGGGCPFRDSIKGDINIYNTTCLQKNLLESEISEFFFKLRKEKGAKKNE